MRWWSAVAVVVILVLAALPVSAKTTLNGGYGGLFTLRNDGTFSASSYHLGATYRPDVEGDAVSPFMFFDNHIVRDGAPDLNMIGGAYSVYTWTAGGLELILEGAAVFKTIENNTAKIGGYGGARVPFTAMGKQMRFHVGGGWDGDDPILAVALNFAG